MKRSELIDTPEREQLWKQLATAHVDNQKKLRQSRDRLRALHAQVLRLARDAEAKRRDEELTFLRLYQRLTENFLQQLELLPLDTDEWPMMEPATQARLEWGNLVAQYLLLQLEQRNLEPLQQILERDLDAALAGEPAVGEVPVGWRVVRSRLAGSAEWSETLRRFREEYPEFREAVMACMQAFETLAFLPGAERLKAAKSLNIPALSGIQYRLVAGFRRVEGGEALLADLRLYPLDLDEASLTVPKKSLTDRVLGFLKKN